MLCLSFRSRNTPQAAAVGEQLIAFHAKGDATMKSSAVTKTSAKKKSSPEVMADKATAVKPLLLTPQEVAAQLGISERTLWGHTHPRGKLICVRMNRLCKYRPADVAAFITKICPVTGRRAKIKAALHASESLRCTYWPDTAD